jgi:hypothetical protein
MLLILESLCNFIKCRHVVLDASCNSHGHAPHAVAIPKCNVINIHVDWHAECQTQILTE